MSKEVLLFTSGLDSYIAREYLAVKNHSFDCLYFDHGGRYCQHEIEKIQSLKFDVIIDNRLKLGDIEAKDAHIPNRNILFTTLALSLGYKKVWLGGTLSDRVGDNKAGVYEKLSSLMTEVNEEYQMIDSPFYHCYKDDIVDWFIQRTQDQGRFELLKNTFSCFNPNDKEEDRVAFFDVSRNIPREYKTKECLTCSACFRKCAVMYSGGVFIPFNNKEIAGQYYMNFTSDVAKSVRASQTLNYIEALNKFWNLKNA